ncbi:MAG: DUF433 domain-containing protein [Chloroflexi bacterium]|nr:DUF433 domain-containing protein [Chloroflexota bacterium]MBI3741753.1 DUF433 domain-containing protein [Chloroflexota bacterium]
MNTTDHRANGSKFTRRKLVRENVNGETYEYYPLGKYIVAAPGICGGRPTFKYTRLEVRIILALIAKGETVSQISKAYSKSRIQARAVVEAVLLANRALLDSTLPLRIAA